MTDIITSLFSFFYKLFKPFFLFISQKEYYFLVFLIFSLSGLFYYFGFSFFGLLLGLIFVFCYLKPRLGIYFLALFIPLKFFIKEVSLFPEIVMAAVIPLALVAIVLKHFAEKKDEGITSNKIDKYLFLIGFAGLISTGFSSYLYGFRIYQLLDFLIFLQLVGFYIVGKVFFSDGKELKSFLKFNLIIANIISFLALLQLRFLEFTPYWVETYEAIKVRIFGTIGNPNALAAYILIITSAYLFILLKEKEINKKEIALFILPLTAFFFTFSRGALIVLMLMYSLLLIYFKKIKILISFILISLTLFLLAPEGFQKRIKNISSPEHISYSEDSGRLWALKNVFFINGNHLLFGSGFGSYGGEYAFKHGSPTYLEGVQGGYIGVGNTDNQWLQIFAQQGLVGIWLFVLLFVALFKDYLKRNLLTLSVIGFFILGFFSDVFQFYQASFLAFILLGVISLVKTDT